MSLAGTIAFHGSTVTLYQGVDTVAADKSSARTYPTNTPGVKLLLEDLSDELLRRVFGPETKATLRGLASIDTTIAKDDGVVVTAGAHAGERFRVSKRLEQRQGSSPHWELALVATEEDFT